MSVPIASSSVPTNRSEQLASDRVEDHNDALVPQPVFVRAQKKASVGGLFAIYIGTGSGGYGCPHALECVGLQLADTLR